MGFAPGQYGTLGVNDQLVAVPASYAFLPGQAVGPIQRGAGASPLSTIPGGVGMQASGSASGSAGASLGMHGALLLIGMFVAGILILQKVHWR